MKQLKQSLAAKIVAWILVTISGITVFASVIGAYLINENGYYAKTLDEIRKEKFDGISGRYSAYALQNLNNTENQTYFADTNFRYGIIKAKDYEQLQNMDLNDDSTYEQRNFTEHVTLDDLKAFQCYVSDDTSIYVDTSLWGYYYISNSSVSYDTVQISEYVYDLDNGIYYYKLDDGRYFPIDKIEYELYAPAFGYDDIYYFEYHPEDKKYHNVTGKEDAETMPVSENIGTTDSSKQTSYDSGSSTDIAATSEVTTDGTHGTRFRILLMPYEGMEEEVCQKATEILNQDTMTQSDFAKEQALCYQQASIYSIPEMGAENGWTNVDTTLLPYTLSNDVLLNRVDYIYSDATTLRTVRGDEGANYYVVSYVQDPLVQKEGISLWGSDLYVQTNYLLGIADHLKYGVYVIAGFALLVFAVSICYLFAAAGHRKDVEGITLNFFNRIPWEIVTLAFIAVQIFLFLLLNELTYAIRHSVMVFYGAAIGFTGLCMAWLTLGYLLDFAVRLKAGSWFRHTLLCRLGKGILHAWETVGENISILWKGIFLFFLYNLLEVLLFVIFGVDFGSIMVIWLIEKAVILAGGIILLVQMKRLKDGGEHIADGDLQYKVNTEHMFPVMKEHGENLNRINEGVSKAVNERMKSERFKTELITNVSHDIKTPLTSIINYVDLLEKEEFENDTAREYLEVLERQSGRLKKLIEDLIEASKASSGALSVNLEKLEAGVFLVQTVGEFEEKTAKNDLELLIKKPEEPVYILADGRHFWRVIDNLMNNICKYAQPQTRVYINLEVKDGKVQIIFMNTSKFPLNISSDELMERFVRGDSSRNTEGNGLGLSIAGSLMELMKGEMKLFVEGDLFKVVLEFDKVEADA